MATRKKPTDRSLADYDAKRDFARTPEPRRGAAARAAGGRSFCVQKHLASTLHYDFRLEHGGVLMSWAVPKGPSLNPADKRMAVRTEDHPLGYGDFEGVIPSGYGAGVVLLWDRGTWQPQGASADVDAALAKGELKFALDGGKLRGSWVLVRTRRPPGGGGREQWLLIKHRDESSGDADVAAELPRSVKSGGDLPDVLATAGEPPEWQAAVPARGGEAGKLFADVIARARELREHGAGATGAAPPKAKAKATKPPVPRGKVPASKKSAAAAKSKSASASAPTNAQPSEPDDPLPTIPASALQLGDRRPTLSNPSKVIYPKSAFTKGDLVAYYTRVAPLILPHLVGRAATLKRYPDGVEGKSFFEKRCNAHRPPWVRTVHVEGRTARDKTIDFCEIADLPSLLWAANLAAIELHVPLALAAAPDRPTAMVFDLDPGPPATAADCAAVALRLKAVLDGAGLQSLVKTSGGKGLHVLVPLNTSGVTFGQTKAFAQAFALDLERDDPKRVISSISRDARAGKVFVDWGQNDRNKTTACLFSLRAREQPTASWPIDWSRLARGGGGVPVVRATDDWDAAEAARLAGLMRVRQLLPEAGAPRRLQP